MCAQVIATLFNVLMYNLCRPGSSWVLPLVYLRIPCMSWDYSPPIRQTPPICIVMLYYTSQASLNSSQLFLLVGHCHTWSAANGRSGLYGCVGHGYVAEVVLADSLDGVCVCRK